MLYCQSAISRDCINRPLCVLRCPSKVDGPIYCVPTYIFGLGPLRLSFYYNNLSCKISITGNYSFIVSPRPPTWILPKLLKQEACILENVKENATGLGELLELMEKEEKEVEVNLFFNFLTF